MVKIKRGDVKAIGQLKRLLKENRPGLYVSAIFAYALTKNAGMQETELKAILEYENKGLGNYNKEKEEIAVKYSEKEKGKPVVRKGVYSIDKNKIQECENELTALNEKYKNVLLDYDNFMNESVEVEHYEIKLSTIPELPSIFQDALYCLVSDDTITKE
jgi:seryl-tRNA synthetase